MAIGRRSIVMAGSCCTRLPNSYPDGCGFPLTVERSASILFFVRLGLLLAALIVASSSADAATTCAFDVTGTTMALTGDCTTDATLLIPDGFTLDGRNFTITATDPGGDHFRGAVVANAGASASIVDTRITALALADVCDSGPGRLRGVFFDGASGAIRRNIVTGLNQGVSRCQEGNAIEVRSLARGEQAVTVEIDHNVIEGYQKSGVVATGDVDVWIHHNRIGASAAQESVAANAVQVGYGAWAFLSENRIAANTWSGFPATTDAATAVLLFRAAPGTTVTGNTIEGNGDVGIYISADGVVVSGNEVVKEGPDRVGYDIGIADYGTGNRVTGNTVRGYQVPYDTLAGRRKSEVAGVSALLTPRDTYNRTARLRRTAAAGPRLRSRAVPI